VHARVIVAGLVACIAAPSSGIWFNAPRAVAQTPGAVEAMARRVDRIAAFGATGAVLVLWHDSIVVAKGVGLADRDARVPISTATPFKLGSLSKQFTAAAIIALERDGKLTRHDSVARFFPNAPADKRAITIEQLLTHTAGLPYLQGISFTEQMSRDELARRVFALPLDAPPGTRYSYSNYGYTLLALVVERASGESFNAYVRRTFFAPAGMSHTGFIDDETMPATWSTHGYFDDLDEGPLSDSPEGTVALGAGTVVSTVEDMGRWARALRDGLVFDAAWRDTLFAPRVDIGNGFQYAYGWNVTRLPTGGRLIVHDGDVGGYNSDMRWYPDEDMWLVVLSNTRTATAAWRDPLVLAIRYALSNAAPEAPARAALTGRYAAGGDSIDIAATGAALTLRATSPSVARAVSATPDPLAANGDSLTARGARVLQRLFDAGPDSVIAALSPSIIQDGADASYRAFAQQLRGSASSVRVDGLGTAVASAGTGTTALRVRVGDTESGVTIGWRAGGIMRVRPDSVAALAFDLAPVADGLLIVYDPFTGRRADIRYALGADRRAASIAIGERIFSRVPGRGARRAGADNYRPPTSRTGSSTTCLMRWRCQV
jgi:CubicO group peptidase (beta-lactamase class C family)